ncbi:hypothetical protein [Rhodopirellula europaea]|uniref:hypothetical protein n=1 Tax=Rhodopirellula europaea TaxID=1263866 RepID=UPI003D2D92B6
MTQPSNEKRKLTVERLASPAIAHSLERSQIAKYHTKGGHGFTAEDANHLADVFHGKRAEIVGMNNEVNGAERIVNGLRIQSKYYQTAAKTVASAFASDSGLYRYAQLVLEVPKDQYDACVELMRKRIAAGKVPGFENPADAEKLIHKGTVTYKQAKNIARAGNIDSLVFDAKSQAVTSSYVLAISFTITFAHDFWHSRRIGDAAKSAANRSFLASGTALVTGVISAQVLRSRAAAVGVASVRRGVKNVTRSSIGRSAVQRLATGSLGRAVYGAAAVNHVSKLLRTNAVAATVATVATAGPDFYKAAFDRSISWKQFTKNVSVNGFGIAAGSAGWLGGSAIGAAVGSALPVVGTAAGGIAGGLLGAFGIGTAGSATAKAVADKAVDDDSQAMLRLMQDEVQSLAFEYMLSEPEIETLAKRVAATVTPDWLRQVYKEVNGLSDDETTRRCLRNALRPEFETLAKARPRVTLPTESELSSFLSDITNAANDKQPESSSNDC